jgi:hypothetical protein
MHSSMQSRAPDGTAAQGRGGREVFVDADLSPITGTHSENSVYSDLRGHFGTDFFENFRV